ncbi:hypothetical protein P4O66_001721 [Electrophorus voltai]|uniref:Uncharacterized protein n=1 Tax=Electrophorus voltai TaxID=2609070 RepID=A0AAD9DT43_9TELE|nr:hypothetical protein P4O66_001721 [Electrophorus voltai]
MSGREEHRHIFGLHCGYDIEVLNVIHRAWLLKMNLRVPWLQLSHKKCSTGERFVMESMETGVPAAAPAKPVERVIEFSVSVEDPDYSKPQSDPDTLQHHDVIHSLHSGGRSVGTVRKVPSSQIFSKLPGFKEIRLLGNRRKDEETIESTRHGISKHWDPTTTFAAYMEQSSLEPNEGLRVEERKDGNLITKLVQITEVQYGVLHREATSSIMPFFIPGHGDPGTYVDCSKFSQCTVNTQSTDVECLGDPGYSTVHGLPCQSICNLQPNYCLSGGRYALKVNSGTNVASTGVN